MDKTKLDDFNKELVELLKKHNVTLKIDQRIVVVPLQEAGKDEKSEPTK